MRLPVLPGLLMLSACASQQPVVMPAEEPVAPKPKEDDLAQAWAPPVETPKGPKIQPPPPLADPRQPFRDALAQAQSQLTANKLDDAASSAKAATELAERTGADERHKAWDLSFRVAMAQGDPGVARQTALGWHEACGPEKVDACRAAALKALVSTERLKGADVKELKKEAETLEKADDCLAQSERAAKALPCFAEAEHLAHTRKDDVLLARAALVKALEEKNDARRAALLERSAQKCERVQCASIRRKAYGALVTHDLTSKNLDAALKHSLKDLQVHLDTLPAELRPWGRTVELDRVCAQYDAANGAGTCRKVEKEVCGGFTFRDYSQQKSAQGLGADVVREVNEHFNPSLQECLTEEARRLIPPDAVRYEVHWTVFNDGRVGEVHLRRDLDETDLAKCLRTRFPLWRYPRYDGEWQNVEQAFTVTATERRTMR